MSQWGQQLANTTENFLPGRESRLETPETHFVTGRRIKSPFPEDTERALFGMGCFWGAERLFWELYGVFATAAGYSGGVTANPNYQEVCSGLTGHAEVVLTVFHPDQTTYQRLLRTFWESHDPTQGMRQGADRGTQYRSAIYTFGDAQQRAAQDSGRAYQKSLSSAGHGGITTEITPASEFYYAEDYHQQYLAKNPNGYCGVGGTGVTCGTEAGSVTIRAPEASSR